MIALTTVLACLGMAGGSDCVQDEGWWVASFDIVYERSGGFAPMPQKLVIGPGREGAVTEVRQGPGGIGRATRLFEPRKKTIRGLRRALESAEFTEIPSPGPDSSCSDCFRYEIRYAYHKVSFDQVSIPASLGPVLERLEAIVEAHRPFH